MQQQQQHVLARRRARTDARAAAGSFARSKPRPRRGGESVRKRGLGHGTTASRGRAASSSRMSCRGTPWVSGKMRAQALVALHQVGERSLQRGDIERPCKPQRDRDRVGRARSFQTVEEPQPALRERQRDLSRARKPDAAQGGPPRASPRRRANAATVGASNRLRMATSTSSVARTRLDQPRRQQRMAAECKEVVVDADALDTQHLGKQRAQHLLLRRARCAQDPGQQIRRRQAPRGRACRSASAAAAPAPPSRRHHVVGKALARAGRAAPPRRRCDRRRNHIGHQPLVARLVLAAPSPPPAQPPHARRSAASISPGSMRKPRSFTCSSARPRNSSAPSDRQRARSPVRYIRLPRLRTGRPQTAPPSAPAAPDSPAPVPPPQRKAPPSPPPAPAPSPPSNT